MSWNDVGNESSKVAFVKLPVGITNLRLLDNTPHSRWQHWMPEAKRSITCIGKGCPVCELIKTAKANDLEPPYNQRKTHSFNVINRTTGQVEILEQGNNFVEELRILHSEKDVTTYDLKVRRTGVGTSTKYRIDMEAVSELTDADKALLGNKTDLAEYFAAPTKEQLLQLLDGVDVKDVFSSKSDDIELA